MTTPHPRLTESNANVAAVPRVVVTLALIALVGCGATSVTSSPATTGLGDGATTTAAPSTAPPTSVAPATTTTTAARPTTSGPEPETTTVATPSPGDAVGQGGTTGPDGLGGPMISASSDWANATYPIDCFDSAPGPVVLVDGRQSPSAANSEITAELRASVDVGDGNTVVLLFCEASSRVNGLHAVLVGPTGTMVDDLSVGPVEALDGLHFTTPVYEDWQVGELSVDAASSQVHHVDVSGDRLTLNDGAITPKCAPIGPDRLDYGPGRVNQGNLVREFQSRLIELGYGDEIVASGGADGFVGRGTMEAFNRYFAANFDYNDFDTPASWLGNDDGLPWVNWLSLGWSEVLELDCTGEYQPPDE